MEDFFDEVLFDIKEEPDNSSLKIDNVNLLIICKHQEYVIEEHQILAHNIVKALGYTLDDTAIVMTIDHQSIANLTTIQTQGYQHVLVFGNINQLVSTQIAVPLNSLMILGEQEWVRTYTLADFGSDKSKKMQLWSSIQHWKSHA